MKAVLAILLTALSLSGPALAACPATSGDVVARIYTADAAFASMDIAGFSRARAEAIKEVGCLQDRIAPNDAAALHRLQGLDAYIAKDKERTLRSFSAAQRLQPDFSLPVSIAPEGNPLYERYEQARGISPIEWIDVRAPRHTQLYVDGQPTDARPVNRPAIVQLTTEDQRVIWSGYVPAGGELPDLVEATRARGGEPGLVIDGGAPIRTGPDRRLLGAAGGAMVASGVAYGFSLYTRSQFDSSETAFEDLEALRGRTNAAAAVSGVLAGAGLGVGAAAFFIDAPPIAGPGLGVGLRW